MYAWFGLFAGLVGFLGGMWTLRHGLEPLAAGHLPAILNRLVKTPLRGLMTGTLVTALLQSSGAVTVITIGLVAAGSLAFPDSIGIILGANIGTCVTTQIIALQLDALVLPCLVAGVFLTLTSRRLWHHIGITLIGFGMIFMALKLMSLSLQPIGRSEWFRRLLLESSDNPWLAVLSGTVLTALVQSSSATTALTIALASQGLVDLSGAVGIVIGNNVGSCVTSVLASIGAPTAAKRVAAAHVLLNVLGAAAFMPILPHFTALIQHTGGTPALQVANAHTFFNIISSIAVLPVARPYAALIERLVPDRKAPGR
ncbi:Na/Pi cotransporter family protein [Kyrpidia spormannii]|uniref:Na/Pi-cotransporter II-related protein n=2 Tax=Kyrpidia spormannii TaxID=2055160 RepID=A0A6F9EBI2_9BACL|nr:Na/Pi symporter [Kyrpidia spormannii]CAB3392918.1 Na/Pi-cotransporter II-related protein [Kyrpidia spormannii]CAB3393834.1 Na/Pi-cotransporter II-related protein [Kyrpidia spormannii]